MVGHLFEAGGERVGVQRPHRGQRAQDDHVQRALEELDPVGAITRASK
jgi:hypothetical protein